MGPTKILAIKLRAMGDTVLFTAPLLELHRLFPEAQIQALVPKPWAPLLQGLPGIDRAWSFEKPSGLFSKTRYLAQLAYSLRKENFDWVLNFHASPSSAAIARACGGKLRAIHFHGHQIKDRYSTVSIPGKGTLKPIIERDMDTIRATGAQIPAGRSPQVFLHDFEVKEASALLKNLNLSAPLLILSLGASRPTKAWPIDRFASLAVEWCLREKGSALALAGPSEANLPLSFLSSVDDQLASAIPDLKLRASIRNRMTAFHGLPLRQLAGVLSQASVVVGNDSGPKHLAIAVHTPTVTIFGPEHPFEWHPYPSERHPYHFIENLPCRRNGQPGYPPWCAIDPCVVEEHNCMKLIGVESVLASCQKVARRQAQDPATGSSRGPAKEPAKKQDGGTGERLAGELAGELK